MLLKLILSKYNINHPILEGKQLQFFNLEGVAIVYSFIFVSC